MPPGPKPAHDVDHLRVAQVGHVLLEGQAEHEHLLGPAAGASGRDFIGDPGGDVGPHVVIDAPSGQDDLRVVAVRPRDMGEVERIDPDAVAADGAGLEIQEVPLGVRRLEDVVDREAEAVEDHGHFVDEGDVEVALGVFDHLRGLGRPDVLGGEHAAGGDGAVDIAEPGGDLRRLAGHHLGDAPHRMLWVPRIYPFGRIAEEKIAAAAEP